MQSDRDLLRQALGYMESVGQMDMHPEEWAIAVALRERLAQPEFDATLQSAAMTQTAAKLSQPEQKRPQNCGTSYCSCIECVMEPEQPEQSPLDRMAENARELGLDYEPVQEPVAWRGPEQYSPDVGSWFEYYDEFRQVSITNGLTPLYTTPPRREWVGLTDDDLRPICDEYRILFGGWVHDFARAVEAKLKENA